MINDFSQKGKKENKIELVGRPGVVHHDDLGLLHFLGAGVVALNDDVVQEGEEHLPKNSLPSVGFQNRPVGGDRGKEGLS